MAQTLLMPVRSMRLEVGARVLPHPGKAATGGEDACFAVGRVFGVFDGVGGWAAQGIDAGLFAREFSSRTAAALRESASLCLVDALSNALAEVTAVGTSTACLVRVGTDGAIDALNVGDSGLRVFRPAVEAAGATTDASAANATRYRLILASAAQQHAFNFPYQLGTGSEQQPADGHAYSCELRVGDMLLLATDGLYDNLYDADIAEVMSELSRRGGTASELAEALCRRARVVSASHTARTPFAAGAAEAGLDMPGGKLDDVTVVCVRLLAS